MADYTRAVYNEDGEPLGLEFIYEDDPYDAYDEDFYNDDY